MSPIDLFPLPHGHSMADGGSRAKEDNQDGFVRQPRTFPQGQFPTSAVRTSLRKKQKARPRETTHGPADAEAQTSPSTTREVKHSNKHDQRVEDKRETHHQRVTRIKIKKSSSSSSTSTSTKQTPKKEEDEDEEMLSKPMINATKAKAKANSNAQEELIKCSSSEDEQQHQQHHHQQQQKQITTTVPDPSPSLPRFIKIYDNGRIKSIVDRGAEGGAGPAALLYHRDRDREANFLHFYHGGRLVELVRYDTLAPVYAKARVTSAPAPADDGGHHHHHHHAFADVYHGATRVAFQDLVTGRFMRFLPRRDGQDQQQLPRIKFW